MKQKLQILALKSGYPEKYLALKTGNMKSIGTKNGYKEQYIFQVAILQCQ